MNKEFKLPDVGEGLTEAEIVRWHVKPGDTVKVNQIIVEIETAKAVVELPSPYEGVVSALLVDEGETVDVGTPIIAVDGRPPTGAEPAPRRDRPGRRRWPRPPRPRRAPHRRARRAGSPCWSATASSRARPAAGRARAAADPARSYPATPSAPPGPARTGGPRSSRPGSGFPRASRAAAARAAGIGAPGRRCRGRGPWPSPPVRQAGQGPRGRPDRADRERARTARSPGTTSSARDGRRRPLWPRLASRPGTAAVRRARSGSRSAGCASTPRRRWWPARSPRRTSPSSSRWTSPRPWTRSRRLRELPDFAERQGLAAAAGGEGAAHRRPPAPDDQLDLGRGRAGDRGQALREPRHRGGHPTRPARAERQGRRTRCPCRTWPGRWAT